MFPIHSGKRASELAPRQAAGRGSKVYCHVIGTYGVTVPSNGFDTFLMRFEHVDVVSPSMVDSITQHVAQGHWLRQSNDAAQYNRLTFMYSADGGTSWHDA